MRNWFNLSTTIECTAPEAFGYIRGHPCIALKMNRIYGWEPEPFYNLTDIESHPTMPTSLKQHIQVVWEKHCSNLNPDNVQCPNLRMVWMSCEGATPHDKEWLGPIMYMPIRGFPGYFYPFLGQQHYLRYYIKSFSKLNLKNTLFF